MATTPSNVETRGPAIVATCIVAPLVSAVFVGLRVYSRRLVLKKFGWDDWCSIATLLVSIPYSVCISINTYHGMGMHTKDLEETPGLKSEYYKWLLISSEFYALSLLGYKTAILLLYVRIFGINKKFRWACYAVMAFNAGYLLSNIILQIFSCWPVPKFWDKTIKEGHCVSLIPPDIAWGAMSMLSDLAIAILPLPMVWRLQLPRKSKYLLSLVFLSGIVAFAVATVRWVVGVIDLTVSEDRVWWAGVTFLVSVLEIHTGIICGCTPTFRPLFQSLKERSRNRSRRKSSDASALGKPSAGGTGGHRPLFSGTTAKRGETSPTGTDASMATTVVGTGDGIKKIPSPSASSVLPPPPAVLGQEHSTLARSASTLAGNDAPEVVQIASDHPASDKIPVSPLRRSMVSDLLRDVGPLITAGSPDRSASALVPRPDYVPPPPPPPPAVSPEPTPAPPNVEKSLPPSPPAIEDEPHPFRLPADEESQLPAQQKTLDPILARYRQSLEEHDVSVRSGGVRPLK